MSCTFECVERWRRGPCLRGACRRPSTHARARGVVWKRSQFRGVGGCDGADGDADEEHDHDQAGCFECVARVTQFWGRAGGSPPHACRCVFVCDPAADNEFEPWAPEAKRALAVGALRCLRLNNVLRVLPGIGSFGSEFMPPELACHYRTPHVRFVARTRVLCQADRARAAADAHGDFVAWLCERAPLWVVVHVCALLRDA